jgi:hypothetical protein
MGVSPCADQAFNDADVAVGGDSKNGVYQAEYSVDAGPAITLAAADGLSQSEAIALNNHGDVIGESISATHDEQVPTLWLGAVPPASGPAPAPVALQTLVPAGTTITQASATLISDNGDIVADASIDGAPAVAVELQPGGQKISGTLTDTNGKPVPGVQVNVTGTDDQGNPVSQQAFSDIDGNYSVPLSPGDYVVAPAQPRGSSKGQFVPRACSGTVSPPACKVALKPGDQATASFKLVKLIVNSTEDTDDPTEVALGVCDVTPEEAAQTCTLRQAIYVADALGGGSVTFDIPGGGVPLIKALTLSPTAPMVIDGTTQPGSHEVAVTSSRTEWPDGFQLGSGVTLRGMTIYGFSQFDVWLLGGGDTLEQDRLGTVVSAHNAIDGFVYDENGGHNVVQGNTIGGTPTIDGTTYFALDLRGPDNTVGGSLPGQGNMISGGFANISGTGDVVQGNKFFRSELSVKDNETVGGPTAVPGAGAGNDITGTLYGMRVGSGDVVQGNHVYDNTYAGIAVQGDGNTIGGASAEMGNLVDENGNTFQATYHQSTGTDDAGIAIGQPASPGNRGPESGAGNVVENNKILNNVGDGGVAVYAGVGNHIFKNFMSGNQVGINLGGGPYRYNSLSLFGSGPNHYQPYPELLAVSRRGATTTVLAELTTGLQHAQETYTVDVYATPAGLCRDSVSEGQGAGWLTSAVVRTDGVGSVRFALSVPAGPGAVTLTATAADGSTSELSPCLSVGHKAPSFSATGVDVPGATVDATSPVPPKTATGAPKASSAGAAKTAAIKKSSAPTLLTATVRPFCPPVTTGYCEGTMVIRQSSNHQKISALTFKLAPGQLGTLTFRLSAALTKLLEHARRVGLTSTTSA